MKNKDIEKMLRSDLKANEPDVWGRIADGRAREECRVTDEELALAAETVTPQAGSRTSGGGTRRRSAVLAAAICLIAMAAVLLLIFLLPGGGYGGGFDIKYSATGYVLLDINPSVQLKLDERGRVTKAVPLNDDARVMLRGRLDGLAGMTDTEAATKILGYAAEVGYVSVDKKTNAVLVSAALDERESEKQLEKKIQTALTKRFKQTGVYGVVITDTKSVDVAAQAEAFGITESKMRLILEARGMGVTVTDAEIPTIAIAEIYERMEDRADALEELVSPELEEEYEALEDRLEDSLETLADRVEEILEVLEEKTEEMGDEYEDLLDRLEDTLDLIEDAKTGAGLEAIFDSIYRELDGIAAGDAELDGLIADVRKQIEKAVEGFSAIRQKIDAEREKLDKKQAQLIDSNRGKNESHQKDKDFDKSYDKWLASQEKLYEEQWDKLKAEWEAELDD